MTTESEHLHVLLKKLRVERAADFHERFSRSLPFAEMLFDRWERARELGFAEGASIYDSALVFGEVLVGEQTWIGPNVILDGSGGPLSIGAYCSISAGVHIYTHDTVGWAISGGARPKTVGPVAIGDFCHIGAQSVIVAGVRIGAQCVVGANSLVKYDVPDCSVVAGSPARIIGRVEGQGAASKIVRLPARSPGACDQEVE